MGDRRGLCGPAVRVPDQHGLDCAGGRRGEVADGLQQQLGEIEDAAAQDHPEHPGIEVVAAAGELNIELGGADPAGGGQLLLEVVVRVLHRTVEGVGGDSRGPALPRLLITPSLPQLQQPCEQAVGALLGERPGAAQHDHVRERCLDHGGQVVRGGLLEGDPQVVVPVDRQVFAARQRDAGGSAGRTDGVLGSGCRRVPVIGGALLCHQGAPLTPQGRRQWSWSWSWSWW